MAKPRTVFVCNACGAEHRQWFGKCPTCNTFGTLQEEVQVSTTSTTSRPGREPISARAPVSSGEREPYLLAAIQLADVRNCALSRFPSGFGEFDRVLGGGIVPGSLVLLGGDPGIGKSTLLLQVADRVAREHRTLYVAAEESAHQIKLRATRLGVTTTQPTASTAVTARTPVSENLYILAETDLEAILRELEALRPRVAVIDSIQTLYYAALSSAPGSVSQVRECTSALMQVAKRANITLMIVGHVTKEGSLAGPRVLEHLVDTVLYCEGDRFASHRLLRAVKNRFGATHEVGVFEMVDSGLREVENPSALFLGSRDEAAPGTATVVACEGTRPLVVELQALVSPTSYSSPRRATTGVSFNRLQQILAVLEKRVGIPLSKLDAYVATAGGLGVEEPAADLGIAVAVVASFRDRLVDPRSVLIGEVGLGGQVRRVPQLELRLREAAKLGFDRAIVPIGNELPADIGIEVVPVGRAIDAIVAAIPTHTHANPSTEDEVPDKSH
ncbi:DNA repair protein RadA [Rubidibacter lacunae KORDI 51-2]|uniref:DNA repair protein RadA n=1 Tax=Rubidibacter lacunae KORDI 51-2 TaxID=582515 RepID=U5DKD5_9CHRO|nr:DNA repair protein RadA [Rubidibacter lacunae]ERN42126.1 DNA repair protein RadA [Rubidibacter lacunae KORDI 51-2]